MMDGTSEKLRYSKNGQMKHELKTINNTSLVAVVKTFVDLLNVADSWAITGSANLAIRGINVQPSDVDIITTRETADYISCLMRDIIPLNFSLSEGSTIRSYYATAELHGFPIDIMANVAIFTRYGAWDTLDSWNNSLEYISTEVGVVPLTSLDFELYVYSLLDFKKRVQLISSVLCKQRDF